MPNRYWVGGSGSWVAGNLANWSPAAPEIFTASCTGTVLTTTGSPALSAGNTVWSNTNVSLGTIVSGSGNTWVVSIGGTYASQTMYAANTGATVPTSANSDTAYFQAPTTYTVTLSGTLTCVSIIVSGGTVAFAGSTYSMGLLSVLNLSTGTSWGTTSTGAITFSGTDATITTVSGTTLDCPITYSPINTTSTLLLNSSVTIGSTRTFTLTRGNLVLGANTLTTGLFASSNSNTRSINFGTGSITVNGAGGLLWDTNTIIGLTVLGTPVVNISNNSAMSTTVSSGSPTEANSISFNFTTGTYALTHTAGSKRNLNFTGFSGTVSNSVTVIYGDLNLGSTANFTAGPSTWAFASTSATPRTITTNAKTMDFPLQFNGIGGSWVLQDAVTLGSSRPVGHNNGTLNLNGKTLTVGSAYSTNSGTKNLTFNGGTLVCPASTTTAFNNINPTNFTTTAGTGTGTISMTAATAKTFVGGGSTFNCAINQGGAGTLTITGANTFDNITNTVQPATVRFTASTNTTFNNFNLNGTAGNLITISSVTAATHTLSKASGTVSCNYLSITNSTATGGASWYAGANSTNVSGNTGWIFTAPPFVVNSGAFFSIL